MPGGPGEGGAGGANGGTVEDVLNVTGTELEGDIYNGSGYNGMSAVPLTVNLEKDSVLTGTIARTETVHADMTQSSSRVVSAETTAEEVAQITDFTIAEYYNIGQVANRYYNNSGNTIELTLADNAVWNITGNSTLSSLTIGENAVVRGNKGSMITMTVDGKETNIEAGNTYTGEIVITYEGEALSVETVTEEDVSGYDMLPAIVAGAAAVIVAGIAIAIHAKKSRNNSSSIDE